MNIINASCFANFSEYGDEKWPTQFTALPRIGDFVESEGG